MTGPTRRALLGLLAAAPLAGAARAQATRRIAAAGPAVTETICALGATLDLLAVDSTSRHPARVRDLPSLGYLRALSAEGVAALRPDLVVLSAEAGPPATVTQLRGLGIPLHVITEGRDVAGVLTKVDQVAAAIGRDGTMLRTALAADLAMTAAALRGMATAPRVLFVLSASNGGLMASGGNTAAQAMIDLAGGRNAVTGYDGYKPINAEQAVAARADAVVLMSHTLEQLGGPDKVRGHPVLALTPAAREGRIHAFDGDYLLGFGPRTAHAQHALGSALHRAALPPLPARPWLS